MSIQNLQSFVEPSFQDPSSFQAQAVVRKQEVHQKAGIDGEKTLVIRPSNRENPKAPTPHILQALVHNLPATASAWKQKMLEYFEQLHRSGPAIASTKIMNEGWAMFTQRSAYAHSKYNSRGLSAELGMIETGVAYPKLDNPYWLGREAWNRLYDRFVSREEIQKLPIEERDTRFNDYAHEIMENYTDYGFLLMALDQKWVEDHKLFLYRPDFETANPQTGPEYNIAVTRDAKRLVHWIVHRVADFRLKIPSIHLVSFNWQHSGVVLYKHNVNWNVPLDPASLVKTLYVMSHDLHEAPVRMKTIGTNAWMDRKLLENPSLDGLTVYPMDVQVNPSGEVQVTSDDPREEVQAQIKVLQAFMERSLNEYLADVSLRMTGSEALNNSSLHFNSILAKIGDALAGQNDGITYTHASKAAQSVYEYHAEVSARLAQRLRAALQGKEDLKIVGGNRVRLNILPEVPEIRLDQSFLKFRSQLIPPTPVEETPYKRAVRKLSINLSATASEEDQATQDKAEEYFSKDEDLSLMQGDLLPGDRWKRPPEKQGNGQGDAQEGDPSDQSEGKPGQAGQGQDADPMSIDIPINLFDEMLLDSIELPNLRKNQNGKNLEVKRKLRGSIQRFGPVERVDLTAEKAFEKGVALAEARNIDPMSLTPEELMNLGFTNMDENEIVVYRRKPVLKPQLNIVIVFTRDGSGSMSDEHIKIIHDAVANMERMLGHRYQHIDSRFVIFGDSAKEVSRKEFFDTHLGGGTKVASGLELTNQILDEYSPSNYNRFAYIFSDGDAVGQDIEDSSRIAQDIASKVQKLGYAHIDPENRRGVHSLSAALEDLRAKLGEKFGFAVLDGSFTSFVRAVPEFFKKKAR